MCRANGRGIGERLLEAKKDTRGQGKKKNSRRMYPHYIVPGSLEKVRTVRAGGYLSIPVRNQGSPPPQSTFCAPRSRGSCTGGGRDG